jgi:hypothetical protein
MLLFADRPGAAEQAHELGIVHPLERRRHVPPVEVGKLHAHAPIYQIRFEHRLLAACGVALYTTRRF